MPMQNIYASSIYRVGKLSDVYTKEDLKAMNNDYTSLVANNEIVIFINYIKECVILKATVGGKALSFNTLPAACPIMHNSKGLLDKEDPGPIPEIYMDRILQKLGKIFPDTEILVVDGKMYLRWE
jgi:hypothetical protein